MDEQREVQEIEIPAGAEPVFREGFVDPVGYRTESTGLGSRPVNAAGDGLELVGWIAAGRCPQDPKFMHVTSMSATRGATVTAGVSYPATAKVDVAHGCGVAAVEDLNPAEVTQIL